MVADRFVKSSLLEGPATERNLKTAGVPTERQSSNECLKCDSAIWKVKGQLDVHSSSSEGKKTKQLNLI